VAVVKQPPLWKQRALKAKAELEAAERKARHDAFWEAVKPDRKLIVETDTFVKPLDYGELGVIE
jgi:hypothetical protein